LELSTPVQKKREAAARAQKAREEEEKRRVEARKREEAARRRAELEREQEAQRLREEAERAAAKRLINPLSESWKTQLGQVAAKARGEFKRAFDDKTSGKGMSDSQKLAVRQTIQRGIPIGNLSMHDFGTLLAKDFLGSDIGWLNDEIINAYLKLLIQREQEKRATIKPRKLHPLSMPSPLSGMKLSRKRTVARRSVAGQRGLYLEDHSCLALASFYFLSATEATGRYLPSSRRSAKSNT